MPTHNKPGRGHHTSRCKHWSGPSLRLQGSMFPFHLPLEMIMHPTGRHASGHKPRRGHYTSRCKHWSGLSQGHCRRKLTCLPPSEPCQHITSLGGATIPADANTGQAFHCAHREACFPFILLWRRSCTPQGGMLLVTSLDEATIPADAHTGQACRRVMAVGSSPAYHRLSHANT